MLDFDVGARVKEDTVFGEAETMIAHMFTDSRAFAKVHARSESKPKRRRHSINYGKP